MKSIHLLLLLGVFCVLIVPSYQYGTIYTDNISTPVNFTDITETYISGIKSKNAHAETATVETITATNPDGFYINTPGELNAQAGEDLEITSAQSVVFGDMNTESTSLTSGGDLHIQNERTDIDVDHLIFSTGNTLSLASDGPLLLQGNNVDISTEGEGFITARDVLIDSATEVNVTAGIEILLNSTHHSSFTTQNGDISVEADRVSTFQANFINIDASYGVEIDSFGDVNLQAFSVLELQAAQFAQIRATEDISITVERGDFDIHAAATAAIATGGDLYFMTTQAEIFSFGDSESVIQFNARTAEAVFSSPAVNIGTFVDSYDVDLISNELNVASAQQLFNANGAISHIAGNDLSFTGTLDAAVSSLNLDATSYGDSEIISSTGNVEFSVEENFNALAKDVYIGTTNDVIINTREASFIQASPAALSRAEPSNFLYESDTITTTSSTTQFDTIGDFILGAEEISVTAAIVDFRSSGGPHNVEFIATGDIDVEADDDIIFRGSNIFLRNTGFNTTSNSLNFVSKDSSDSIFLAENDFLINSPTVSISSGEDTTIEAENEVNFIMSDSFVQNSYNTHIQSRSDINVDSKNTITVGAHEYINAEAANDIQFESTSLFASADQTGSIFANSIQGFIENFHVYAGDTHYFTANLPTDELSVLSNTDIEFRGDTVFQSGRDLQITADESTFVNQVGSLLIQGYDAVSISGDSTLDFDSDAQITVKSDGSISLSSNTNSFTATSMYFIGETADSKAYYNLANLIQSSTDFTEEAFFHSVIASAITLDQDQLDIDSDGSISIATESTLTTKLTGSYAANSNYYTLKSLANSISSEEEFVITAGSADITALNENIFSAGGLFTVNSNEAWFLGDELFLQGKTLNFDATKQGYFYSDNEINFDITDSILVSSEELQFVLPLDGVLDLSGEDTVISGDTSPLSFISNGATTITSGGDLEYTATGNSVFTSATTQIIASERVSFEGKEGTVTFFAHEGEVDFESETYSLSGSSNSFLASRNVNLQGGSATFTSFGIDADTTVTQNTYNDQSVSATLSILAETEHEDSHIVFHSLSGDISNDADGSIFINSDGTQAITGAFGFSSVAGEDTFFTIDGNHNLQTSTGTLFDSNNDWSLKANGQVYIQSGLEMHFENSLEHNPESPFTVFQITADAMTVSTSQNGDFKVYSDSDLKYTTTGSQSWEVTHAIESTSTDSDYTATAGDIVTLTSAGKISSEFLVSFAADATVNVTFNSGHDSTFTSETTNTYHAGTDILTRSLNGEIVFTNGGAASFVAGGQVSIAAEGARTIPRDGVYFGSNNILLETTGASSQIYLYAKRAVTFGEVTRPDVRFNAGGSGTQIGWALSSDGNVVLHAGAGINFDSERQFLLSTLQTAVFNSGASFDITTGSLTGTSDNILINSLHGNVHFHSQLNSKWETSAQFSATSTTGYISFTTLDSAVFSAAGNFKETANSIKYSLDSSYSSYSTLSTTFDGRNVFDITTTLGSDGSILFESANSVFSSGGNFNINTYGDNAYIQLSSVANMTVSTLKSGLITISSEQGLLDFVSEDRFESANKAYTITSNSNLADDPSHGFIEFYARDSTIQTSQDTIDFTAAHDVSIVAGTLAIDTTGDFLANSNWDQEWRIGSSDVEKFTSVFTVDKNIVFRNSAESGGDINFVAAGKFDIISFQSVNGDIVANIGENQIGHIQEGFRVVTSGSDFREAFGIRFQTEGVDADLEVYASASATFTGHKNLRFDASKDLDVYAGIGISLAAQGVNLDNQGVLFVASNGDIKFNTAQSPISFIGNHIDVIGNGTSSNEGVVKLIANGISKDSEYGIRMQFDAAVAAFGSIAGDINVVAQESIDINLNYQGAHALFGYQRNAAEALANIFPYDPFYPYIPSNHLNVPLNSETYVYATGLSADIVFDTQKTEDGVGQFIAFAGTIEEVGKSETNAPSQLQMIAYGNGNITGDITFTQAGGLSFRGFDRVIEQTLGNVREPPIQSNIIFQANEDASDIEIKTTREALFSDINFITTELNINAEDKLLIRSNDRNGDSTVQFYSDFRIRVSTTGPSDGPDNTSGLGGIDVRAYKSKIFLDAGDYGDVIHHALRNAYVVADNGWEFTARENILFSSGSTYITSSSGGVTFRYASADLVSDDVYIHTTSDYSYNDEISGGNINYFADDISIDADDDAYFAAIGGDIIFNFNEQVLIQGAETFVYGFMSIPMTNQLIVPGSECSDPSSTDVQRIVIARSPPFDERLTTSSSSPQYNFDSADIYQGLGLRICTCGNPRENANYSWACMDFSQFQISTL